MDVKESIEYLLLHLNYPQAVISTPKNGRSPEAETALGYIHEIQDFIQGKQILFDMGDDVKKKIYIRYMLRKIEPKIKYITDYLSNVPGNECPVNALRADVGELRRAVEEYDHHHDQTG